MFIVFGQRFYGKVDQVPGLFCVSTKFLHFEYVPLIPCESCLIFDDGTTKRGVKLSISGKSVVFAWLRTGLLVATVLSAFFGVFGLAVNIRDHKDITEPAIGLAVAVVTLGVFFLTYFLSRAGMQRALLLVEKVGLDKKAIEDHFATSGQSKTTRRIPDVLPQDLDDGRPAWDKNPQ